jgi:hypothetical protein
MPPTRGTMLSSPLSPDRGLLDSRIATELEGWREVNDFVVAFEHSQSYNFS